jgi:hypothetical protein
MELIKQYKIDCRVVINTLNLSVELLLLKYELCFEMLEMNSASQNHLPCRGLKNVSKVAVLLKLQLETG